MVDREKVIKGLEHCGQPTECDGCPYDSEMDGCFRCLKDDALKLLKEQEPKLVNNIEIYPLDTVGDCPSCGLRVRKRYHPLRCGVCGQAIKWE